jgi:hypothetical protein
MYGAVPGSIRYESLLRRDQFWAHLRTRPPTGYAFVKEGESQKGDLMWCDVHKWEVITDYPCSVFGYNAVVRPIEGLKG